VIQEQFIDEIIISLDSSLDNYRRAIQHIKQSHPLMLDYIMSDDMQLLMQTERDLLLFNALVIFESATESGYILEQYDPDQIEELEEQNYLLWEGAKGPNFRDKLDKFFENYPEEDLLAFVEDSLEDDDNLLSKEGKLPILIKLKTLIDIFILFRSGNKVSD